MGDPGRGELSTARRAPGPPAIGARALAVLIAIGGLSGSCSAPPQNDAPPVVLISVDTLRRDHLSLYGYPRETSPRLDALAREAVVFDAAMAAHTNTGPSHATILSGLYPPAHGSFENGMPVRDEVRTLAHVLAERGYETAAFVGGWTLSDQATGLGDGFAVYEDRFDGWQRRADATVELARRWLETRDDGPFFLLLHFFDPHHPYDAPEPFFRRFAETPGTSAEVPGTSTADLPLEADRERLERAGTPAEIAEYVARYDGEIAWSDHQLGRFLDLLRERDLYDRALLVVTADHGETLGERAWPFDHGGRVYEEQVRVPLLLRLPEGRHGGRRMAAPVHHVDLVPTVLDALGSEAPAGLHGRSLLPFLDGETTAAALERRPLFSLSRPEPRRVPEVPGRPVKRGQVTALRLPAVKLVHYPGEEGALLQLFDLRRDPDERINLAGAQPRQAAELYDVAREWWRATRAGERTEPPELSDEAREALRALGYL